MALKSILKNKASQEAGPSKRQSAGATKPQSAPKAGSKGSMKATVAAPTKGKGKSVKVVEPEPLSEEDADEEDDMMEEDEEPDTEDEIERAQAGTEKKPQKRKRITTAEDFGSTLTSLLSEPIKTTKKAKKATTDEAPALDKQAGQPILSLSAKPLPPSQAAVSLERRAARALKAQKEERLDRARIRNVLEGWVPAPGLEVGSQEFERGLRKTAQRGVIKLFNAILVASKNAEAAAQTLSQKAGLKPEAPKNRKEKDNILGRGGREDVLTKESFLDLVRKGGAK